MAQNNAINKKSGSLTIDPGSSGDSWLQHNINTTGEFRIGIDDGSGDTFNIATGSAITSSDPFIIDANGHLRLQDQPCFAAKTSSDKTNVTGDGTAYTVIWDTSIFDNNSDFNTGTGTFTAPVTGKYYLIAKGTINCPVGGGDTMEVKIVTSNRTYTGSAGPLQNQVANYIGGNNWISHTFGVLADMDATDTATVTVTDAGGAKTDDFEGGSNVRSGFYGVLIC